MAQITGADRHPIERIMSTALTRLKDLVDTDTIIGSPMSAVDGTVIIPVSRVSMGFVGGGGEYDTPKRKDDASFAGGSGAGLSVVPIGFLIGQDGKYSMVGMERVSAYEKLLDLVPDLIESVTKESDDAARN